MEVIVMYYCIECMQLHVVVDTTLIFRTGFHFVNNDKLPVGLCQKHTALCNYVCHQPIEESMDSPATFAS
jgi:hypothetical protein